MKVFVLTTSRGEYSDARTSVYGVYSTIEKAELGEKRIKDEDKECQRRIDERDDAADKLWTSFYGNGGDYDKLIASGLEKDEVNQIYYNKEEHADIEYDAPAWCEPAYCSINEFELE